MTKVIRIVSDYEQRDAVVFNKDDKDEPVDLDDAEDDLEITERSDDIAQVTMDYLAQLADIDDYEMTDLFDSKNISFIVDRIEKMLWDEFGFQIYRPRKFIDRCGIEHVVYSLIEIQELMGNDH